MLAPPERALSVQEKKIHKDFVNEREMQHARNDGGIDTKVIASSPRTCLTEKSSQTSKRISRLSRHAPAAVTSSQIVAESPHSSVGGVLQSA